MANPNPNSAQNPIAHEPLSWLSPVAAGLSTGAGIAQGLAALFGHRKMAKTIQEQEKTIPESLLRAQTILEDLAVQGLPGLDNMRAELEAELPTSINQLKELAVSPSGMLGAAANMQTSINKGLRGLLIEDANRKTANRSALANFLSFPMAQAENRVEDFNVQKNIMAQEEKMAGVSELFEGIGGGISGGISAFGQGKMTELLASDTFKKYLEGSQLDQPVSSAQTGSLDFINQGLMDIMIDRKPAGQPSGGGQYSKFPFMDVFLEMMGTQNSLIPLAK